MKYILDITLMDGYEEMSIMLLDQVVKGLYDRGCIGINKQEKIGKPFFETIENKLNDYKRRYK